MKAFIFDPVNGDSYLTNTVGVFILKHLREARPPAGKPTTACSRRHVLRI